jgi:outer membrane lipoprotein-sorting protein
MTMLRAQGLPDAATLLERSAHALDGYQTYQFEFSAISRTTRSDQINRLPEISGSVSGTHAGAWHIEATSSGANTTVIDDGRTAWTYNHLSNSYTAEGHAVRLFGLLARVGVSGTPAIFTGTPGAVREETINVDGEAHECWVVDTFPPPPFDQKVTTWIDKQIWVDWQVATDNKYPNLPDLTTTIRKSKLRLNPGLPDSMFVFTPPPGAQQRALPLGVH